MLVGLENIRAGPAKKVINNPTVVSRKPLRIRTRNLEALTVTHHLHVRTKKYVKKCDMLIIQLDIDEISAKTPKHQLFNAKVLTK